MHHYEFLYRANNRLFSKIPTPVERQRRQSCLSTRCGSEVVEQRWFYFATTQSAGTNREARPTGPFENMNFACHSLRAACRVKVLYACKEITRIPQ